MQKLLLLSSFWRSLDLPLINCEIELDMLWSITCTLSEISRTSEVYANPAADPPIAYAPPTTSNATFQINSGKLYVPVVTLPINDNIKFLQNIK